MHLISSHYNMKNRYNMSAWKKREVKLVKTSMDIYKHVVSWSSKYIKWAMTWFLFVWFDSLRPISNLSVIKGQIFLGWTSTKLGLMCLAQEHHEWLWWGSNPWPLGLESSTLPLSHCALSCDVRFPTMWYVRSESLRPACAVWSEPLTAAWIFTWTA